MIMGDSHKNNFGFLRLLFAYLVILAHANIWPIQLNLFGLQGSFSAGKLGGIAVDGFFLISGYLIFKSFSQCSSTSIYLKKRILRIYPGFIAASIFCIFAIVPLASGWVLVNNLSYSDWIIVVSRMILLYQVTIIGAFPNFPDLPLNSPMWTIKFEFLCYLIVPILGLFLTKRKQYLTVTITLCIGLITTIWFGFNLETSGIFSFIHKFARLTTAFLIGGLFYFFRDCITWNKKSNLLCFALIIIAQLSKYSAEMGILIFGGYLLFNFALNFKNMHLSKIGIKNDISYGVYLYAWPLQVLIAQLFSSLSTLENLCFTLICATILGYLSWIWIEKPFLLMKKWLNNQILTNK